jgi:hypothetical protein
MGKVERRERKIGRIIEARGGGYRNPNRVKRIKISLKPSDLKALHNLNINPSMLCQKLVSLYLKRRKEVKTQQG